MLVPFVPHASVLPHAAVTVTHAGHGTVAASLSHGVPLVALPNLAADQPALAGQVAKLGAGIALDGERATPGEIADACRRVLADGAYVTGARSARGPDQPVVWARSTCRVSGPAAAPNAAMTAPMNNSTIGVR